MPDSGNPAATATAVIIAVVLVAGLYVWTAASLQALFHKAGEQGWKGWVPVLNTITLLHLGGYSGWWVALALVPGGAIAVYVVYVMAAHRVGRAFGFGSGMTVLAALLPPVWSSVLGWGSARWLGPDPAADTPGGAWMREAEAGVPAAAAGVPAWGPPTPPAPPASAAPPASVGAVPPASAGPPPSSAVLAPVPMVVPPVPAGPRTAGGLSALTDDELEGIDDLDEQFAGRGSVGQTPPTTPAANGFDTSEGASDLSDAPAAPLAASRPPAAPAPISSVPLAPSAPADPWAPPADDPARTPRRSPMPETTDPFSETSAEVSAVAGAPMLGAPMAARSSVSALRNAPELPDAESAFDETIIAARHRPTWMLTPPVGAPIAITENVLIIGRRPVADPLFPTAQLIEIVDETRTVSKTHARLELHDDRWMIVDLESTNGVVLLDADGGERELPQGVVQPATERMLFGDAEVRLTGDRP